MGAYEREQQMIAAGIAERGQAAREYFAELDAQLTDENSRFSHRPDYSRTLFAPENDDIYREFCAFLDQPEPRHFDEVEDPISIEGYTAAEIYYRMIAQNFRVVSIDGAAVYNMLAKLRMQPEIAKKALEFRSSCSKAGGC